MGARISFKASLVIGISLAAGGAAWIRIERHNLRQAGEISDLMRCLDQRFSARPLDQRRAAVWIVDAGLGNMTVDQAFQEFVRHDPDGFASRIEMQGIKDAPPRSVANAVILDQAKASFASTMSGAQDMLTACEYPTAERVLLKEGEKSRYDQRR